MADKPADKTGKFDTGLIRELAAILREADLGEIEVEQSGVRIKVAKSSGAVQYAAAPAVAAPAAVAAAPAAAAPVTKASLRDHPGAVKSPMVGTVYLQAEEGAPKFVKVGDTVNAGATLLLVEAMKTFNPVTAPRGGKVTQILIENQQPVEFGEPLVIIE
ncbi:MAG TPA: acetyl-CoA carboxylase biotin carboxyl carrier protein subunit [Hyphomonadaceae bacterium]|nr:acetyl-CoA carboxylase biotin carboxyl carrier protein subunit [Hyphomonadaceae bacterium]HPN06841.1 acetyl-CoA carboxylase biotin carboxyl carrier protein subunit [Hyphomonadaceae bacterium]